jgi:hypothetical protein
MLFERACFERTNCPYCCLKISIAQCIRASAVSEFSSPRTQNSRIRNHHKELKTTKEKCKGLAADENSRKEFPFTFLPYRQPKNILKLKGNIKEWIAPSFNKPCKKAPKKGNKYHILTLYYQGSLYL